MPQKANDLIIKLGDISTPNIVLRKAIPKISSFKEFKALASNHQDKS